MGSAVVEDRARVRRDVRGGRPRERRGASPATGRHNSRHTGRDVGRAFRGAPYRDGGARPGARWRAGRRGRGGGRGQRGDT